MSRVFVIVFVAAAAAAVHQTAVRANGSPMPAPSGGGPSASMPVVTPEQLAAQAYNSGISHKNKGLKLEADAEKATKDKEKILGKAKDEYGKALKDLKKALDLKPDAFQAFNGMGFALRKTGDSVKAPRDVRQGAVARAGIPRRARVSRRSLSRAQPRRRCEGRVSRVVCEGSRSGRTAHEGDDRLGGQTANRPGGGGSRRRGGVRH